MSPTDGVAALADSLAHQGGWDEILMVAGPLLIFAAVLYLANRRANARLREADAEITAEDAVAEG